MPGLGEAIGHAEIMIGESPIMPADEYSDMNLSGHKSLKRLGGALCTQPSLTKQRR